ncbi:DNA-formamidopyrimidine glycosylase family protein [Mycetocola spongiae]|uniref:DNA-formamidopyrimidine glycosylase family protein n=1 Tax=Mycetocola spongiae TaxID=2859226 RepID=UPI001CF4D914|nr:DNA-formamidopyrimidine glycosylase family protein [Mycetocola spongiae]UCR88528.1 Fpg/Nei family DNA glycosylase [Mycetocola spongiae]
MPEGDTLFRAARNLNRELAGHVVTGWDLRVPEYATSDLTGARIHGVIARGKNLLLRVDEFTLHTHLRMEGSWHLYRPGSPWRRPAFQARAVIDTEPWQAVGFDLGLVRLFPTAREAEELGHLGPDLLGPDWDAAEAVRRLTSDPARPIAVALQDQRNLAGLGNEYVNELCFLRGVLPTRPVAAVDLPPLVDLAARLIRANRDRAQRITTGDARPGRSDWVFARERRPCRRCGTPIRKGRIGADATRLRDSYWCPRCQT